MHFEPEVPLSNEAELDRQMSQLIAKWVERGVQPKDEVDRYQELSMKRAKLMHGGARLLNRARHHAA
jgi:ribosomal protein S16